MLSKIERQKITAFVTSARSWLSDQNYFAKSTKFQFCEIGFWHCPHVFDIDYRLTRYLPGAALR